MHIFILLFPDSEPSTFSQGRVKACGARIHFYKGLLLSLLHSERPKLHTILAFLSAITLNEYECTENEKGRYFP